MTLLILSFLEKLRQSTSQLIILLGALLCAHHPVWAGLLISEDPNWKDAQPVQLPAFSKDKLIVLSQFSNGTLTYGIDPSTISITPEGVVRFVVMASNESVTNAMYEGIKCSTAEYKIYARATGDGVWSMLAQSDFTPMKDQRPSPHAMALARAGLCDGAARPLSVRNILQSLAN